MLKKSNQLEKSKHYEISKHDIYIDKERSSDGDYWPDNCKENLHGKYKLVERLGFGFFSTVWLCSDTYHRYTFLCHDFDKKH